MNPNNFNFTGSDLRLLAVKSVFCDFLIESVLYFKFKV
jgi:hypothetical protein